MAGTALTCPSCQGQFDSSAAAGQQAQCPHCGRPVFLPAATVNPVVWYVTRGRERSGPYPLPQLHKMVHAGEVKPNDLVWKEGMSKWVEARWAPELYPVPVGDNEATAAETAIVAQAAYAPTGMPMEWPRPAGGTGFWLGLWVNVRRAFSWNLSRLPVTQSEKTHLHEAGVDEETAQRFMVWRRSIFLLVAVVTCLGFVLQIISTATHDYRSSSGFGVFKVIMELLAQMSLPAASILACVFWSRLRLSRWLMFSGWAVSFVIPVILALVPFRMTLSYDEAPDEGSRAAANFLLAVVGGIVYYLQLLPSVLSLIPGLLRGCIRIKALTPESVLPGWFLVAGSPLYMLLWLVVFVLVNQIASNALLVFGVIFLMAAPLVYVVFAGLLTRPLSSKDDLSKIVGVQLTYSIIAWLAAILLLIYAFTKTLPFPATVGGQPVIQSYHLVGWSKDTSLVRPWEILQYYIEFAGRSLFLSVLFADFLMMMNLALWRNLRQFARTEPAEHYDRLMGKLDDILARK